MRPEEIADSTARGVSLYDQGCPTGPVFAYIAAPDGPLDQNCSDLQPPHHSHAMIATLRRLATLYAAEQGGHG